MVPSYKVDNCLDENYLLFYPDGRNGGGNVGDESWRNAPAYGAWPAQNGLQAGGYYKNDASPASLSISPISVGDSQAHDRYSNSQLPSIPSFVPGDPYGNPTAAGDTLGIGRALNVLSGVDVSLFNDSVNWIKVNCCFLL